MSGVTVLKPIFGEERDQNCFSLVVTELSYQAKFLRIKSFVLKFLRFLKKFLNFGVDVTLYYYFTVFCENAGFLVFKS